MGKAVLTTVMAWAWMTSSAAMDPMLSSKAAGQERGAPEAELGAGLDRLRFSLAIS